MIAFIYDFDIVDNPNLIHHAHLANKRTIKEIYIPDLKICINKEFAFKSSKPRNSEYKSIDLSKIDEYTAIGKNIEMIDIYVAYKEKVDLALKELVDQIEYLTLDNQRIK